MAFSLFELDDIDAHPAHLEMNRLFSLGVDHSYPLNGLWRAAGSPAGKDPKSWLKAAEHLVAGMASYFARLEQWRAKPPCHPARGTRDEVVSVITDTDTDDDAWRAGDTFATFALAELYARFLDFGDKEENGPGSMRPKLRVVHQ